MYASSQFLGSCPASASTHRARLITEVRLAATRCDLLRRLEPPLGGPENFETLRTPPKSEWSTANEVMPVFSTVSHGHLSLLHIRYIHLSHFCQLCPPGSADRFVFRSLGTVNAAGVLTGGPTQAEPWKKGMAWSL